MSTGRFKNRISFFEKKRNVHRMNENVQRSTRFTPPVCIFMRAQFAPYGTRVFRITVCMVYLTTIIPPELYDGNLAVLSQRYPVIRMVQRVS